MDLPMSTFFVAYRTTTLPPDAILSHIRIPLSQSESREVLKAYKQAKRKDDDIAIVTSAFRLMLDDAGNVEDICLVYGGMAPLTKDAKKTKKVLIGKRWFCSETLDAALTALGQEF